MAEPITSGFSALTAAGSAVRPTSTLLEIVPSADSVSSMSPRSGSDPRQSRLPTRSACRAVR